MTKSGLVPVLDDAAWLASFLAKKAPPVPVVDPKAVRLFKDAAPLTEAEITEILAEKKRAARRAADEKRARPARVRKTEAERRAASAARSREWRRRKAQDPAFRAKTAEQQRVRMARMKIEDPDRWEALTAKRRERDKRPERKAACNERVKAHYARKRAEARAPKEAQS